MAIFSNRRAFIWSMVTAAGSGALGMSGEALGDALLATATVPGWVPTQGGTVRTVATVNSFLSQNGKLPGWEYAFGKIVDDYSGAVFNPYWGTLGAMVFHGGGHAATFDNSVVILDLNDLTFKRLSNPTPSGDGANWTAMVPGSPHADQAFKSQYCEYGNGQPGAGHTYDTLAILPPADGGAPCGSLVRVSSHAVHVNASCNSGWAHRFDFRSLSMRDGSWVRWSVNGPTSYLNPGACSAYDALRKRFWWTAALSSAPPMVRYLDVATQRQLEIAFTNRAAVAPAAHPDSATMRYDAQRDQLLLTCTVGGKAALAYLRCTAPELGWTVATLSGNIPVQEGAALPFDFVPEAEKMVLLSAADNAAFYDVLVPPNPASLWTVMRRPIVGVAIPTAYVVGKRWSYVPALKSFVWMASSKSAVLACRPFGI